MIFLIFYDSKDMIVKRILNRIRIYEQYFFPLERLANEEMKNKSRLCSLHNSINKLHLVRVSQTELTNVSAKKNIRFSQTEQDC